MGSTGLREWPRYTNNQLYQLFFGVAVFFRDASTSDFSTRPMTSPVSSRAGCRDFLSELF
jgi:hypothetical protein